MKTLESHGISFGDRRTKLSISPNLVKLCAVCGQKPRRVEYDLVMVDVDGIPYNHPVVYGFVKRQCSSECALRDTGFPFVSHGRHFQSVEEYRACQSPTKGRSLGGDQVLEWELEGLHAQFLHYSTRPDPATHGYYPLVNYRQTFLYEHLYLGVPIRKDSPRDHKAFPDTFIDF
jgi:hypothetical protein